MRIRNLDALMFIGINLPKEKDCPNKGLDNVYCEACNGKIENIFPDRSGKGPAPGFPCTYGMELYRQSEMAKQRECAVGK